MRNKNYRKSKFVPEVPEQIKTVRSNIMLEMDEKKRAEYEKDFVGKEVEVLFEEKITKNEEHYWVGHTKEYVKIALQTEENLQNQLAIVRIDKQSQIIRWIRSLFILKWSVKKYKRTWAYEQIK